ncbi:MAG: trypsin-like peptidase domain-containing protein [Anaerolineae bacterium]|nr:trypsin-like peptidase domain-containing protein [Anaerolineae bacterium]
MTGPGMRHLVSYAAAAVLMVGCASLPRATVATAPPEPTAAPTPAVAASPALLEAGRLDQLLEAAFVELYERASPSVVHITARAQVFDFFRGVVPNEGTGSGFFFDDQGHIVTNNHVVEGADEIEVILADGTRAPARVIGTDAYSDLAVLQVENLPREQIKPLPLGTTRNLKVGMLVIAIGNPFGLDRTMTTGIISALGRTIEREDQAALGEVIQTDAAINPGNSGGPLLNLRGEVIGVNTAIRSPSGGSVGIGFAVPADTVARVVPELIAKGRYDHPWLGITAYEITPDLARALELPTSRGLLIAQVQPGAAAHAAGVRGATQQMRVRGGYLLIGGDILTAVDEQPTATRDQLTIYLENNKRVGDPVTLSLIRDGRPITLTAKLTARP